MPHKPPPTPGPPSSSSCRLTLFTCYRALFPLMNLFASSRVVSCSAFVYCFALTLRCLWPGLSPAEWHCQRPLHGSPVPHVRLAAALAPHCLRAFASERRAPSSHLHLHPYPCVPLRVRRVILWFLCQVPPRCAQPVQGRARPHAHVQAAGHDPGKE